jgi:hypothetical protein
MDDIVGRVDKALAGNGADGHKTKQADALFNLALEANLFRAPDGTAFAEVIVNGHRETLAVQRKAFKQWLTRRYYEAERTVPSSEAMKAALAVVCARAQFDAPEHQVFIRVAEHNNRIYLDLGDTGWRAIEIDATGWRVVDESPVRFRRAGGMKPLPVPRHGGRIDALRPFLNLKREQEFVLYVACLLAALSPSGPYPVLCFAGEHGGAKSTACRIFRALVDPNTAPLRALPHKEHDLVIAANNAHILCFDNISEMRPGIADALCRIATGGVRFCSRSAAVPFHSS